MKNIIFDIREGKGVVVEQDWENNTLLVEFSPYRSEWLSEDQVTPYNFLLAAIIHSIKEKKMTTTYVARTSTRPTYTMNTRDWMAVRYWTPVELRTEHFWALASSREMFAYRYY